jgi:hypothetical protein
MGNFDAYTMPKRDMRLIRSVLRHDVGPNARNAPEDLRIITRTLASAGILDADANPALTHSIIFKAIRHARRTLVATAQDDGHISPGDDTERALRRALAHGRLPLSHRAVIESRAPKGARSVIDGGMQRALAKLRDPDVLADIASPYRRALLPVVSAQTFRANRRLAEALATEGHIAGIELVIAETVGEGGKQGYSDVRDFVLVLKSTAPDMAAELYEHVSAHLEGKARRRFRKLYFADPPAEGDFT